MAQFAAIEDRIEHHQSPKEIVPAASGRCDFYMTQVELAKIFGVSVRRIQQLEKSALRKIAKAAPELAEYLDG